jgi:hypothetical protein
LKSGRTIWKTVYSRKLINKLNRYSQKHNQFHNSMNIRNGNLNIRNKNEAADTNDH